MLMFYHTDRWSKKLLVYKFMYVRIMFGASRRNYIFLVFVHAYGALFVFFVLLYSGTEMADGAAFVWFSSQVAE
jgi:hypothetical protein